VVVVLGEDVAALLGLLFALIAVLLTMLTGNPVYDAAGSIGIGALLIIVSIFLAVKIKGLLIGQSADEKTVLEIKEFIESRHEVDTLMNIITFQLGPDIMVAVKARMKETQSASVLIDHINLCEREIKKNFPDVKWMFFEPDIADSKN